MADAQSAESDVTVSRDVALCITALLASRGSELAARLRARAFVQADVAVARAAVEDIRVGVADGAAFEHVVTRAAVERVDAVISDELVVRRVAGQRVVVRAAPEVLEIRVKLVVLARFTRRRRV